jgi:hypothetical protein
MLQLFAIDIIKILKCIELYLQKIIEVSGLIKLDLGGEEKTLT